MSDLSTSPRDFFVAGGTLGSDAPSYVTRPADVHLYHLVQSGMLCYVLTTRQMGKSSLMNRLGTQLRSEGVETALIDLTAIGTASLEAWYISLLDDLQFQLPLETDVTDWWQMQAALSPVKRFTKFFRDVILTEVEGKITIFIDEVDSALKLDFSDDFFAAVRAIYNQTLMTSDAGRLSFVLLGVAMPHELIKSQHRTPFNVGERIELEELALADVRVVFTKGLPAQNAAIIDRVYYWTNGHPYLTQRIGQAIVRDGRTHWVDQDVDELVTRLFFTERSLVEESNLQFVNGRVLSSPRKNDLLYLYQNIFHGQKTVPANERDNLQAELKLYGLVKVNSAGNLVPRNRIYQQAFDQAWIRRHTPARWRQRLWLALIVITILSVGLSIYFWQNSQRTSKLLAETYITTFSTTENATLRLDSLAQLLALGGYEQEVVTLFIQIPLDDKVALFTTPAADLQRQVEQVIVTLYVTQTEDMVKADAESTQVLAAMLGALHQFEHLENPAAAAEIDNWLQGRTAVLQNDLDRAQLAYSVALSLNGNNPATRYERAQVALLLADYEAALADLSALPTYEAIWQGRVQAIVARTPQLYPLIMVEDSPFANLITFVPTPTSRFTATRAPVPEPAQTADTAVIATRLIATPTHMGPIPVFAELPLIVPHTPPTGDIVYTCFVDGVDQICAIAADGSNQRRLTFSGATDWAASFVPGGQEILFSSARSGAFAIYQIDATGDNSRLIARPDEGGYAPLASPDGGQIAFVRAKDDSQNILVMDTYGHNVRPLTNVIGDALNPVWSPDGQQIAYGRRLAGEDAYTLVIMDAAGTSEREILLPLTGIGSRTDWSPDGQWLAFYAGPSNDHDIYLVAVDGSEYRRLTYGGDNLGPSFSADGRWLVFTSSRDGDNELYLIRVDGSGLTQLTVNGTSDWQPRWAR